MNVAVETAAEKGTLIGRALELLGSNVPQEAVASALGVTASYVTQLLSDENFAAAVTKLKYEALQEHTARDSAYDSLEDTLLTKLERAMPLMMRPADILGAIKVINGAKRRGLDSKESLVTQQNIVSIVMPVQIVQEFTTNTMNQVVKAGEQDLITIQSGDLRKQVETKLEELEAPKQLPEAEETKLLESNTILDAL